LFVSHRLDEVLALTDRVTVLRDGRAVSAHDTARLSEQELIEAILGRRAAATRERRSQVDEGPIVLEISRLTAGPLRDVSLMIRAGEVVGIAGLLGSGRSELLRAVYGDLSREAGTIAVNGKPAHFQRKDQAIGRGVVMIPEDRAAGGIFADLSVAENLNASVLRRYWRLLFRTRKLRRDSADLIARFAIKTPTDSVPIAALSGGNQQKTVFARWLRRDPVLLLLDEPAQGVDVGARADIYAAVREVTDAGGAALVVASDLEELAQVVDRALVLRNGAITAEVQLADLSAQRLNELIYEGGRDVWSGPSAERP
jgi:ribose transport system ATP-binding protein